MHEASHDCMVHFHCIHIYTLLRGPHWILIIIRSLSPAFLPCRVIRCTQTHTHTHVYIPVQVSKRTQFLFPKLLYVLTENTHVNSLCPGAEFSHSLLSSCKTVCSAAAGHTADCQSSLLYFPSRPQRTEPGYRTPSPNVHFHE